MFIFFCLFVVSCKKGGVLDGTFQQKLNVSFAHEKQRKQQHK